MTINDIFAKYKDEADSCYNPEFFSKERVRRLAVRARLEEANIDMLMDFLSNADEETFMFMWQLYYFQYCSSEDFRSNIVLMEHIARPHHSEAKFPGCINAVVYLMAVENLEKWLDGKDLDSNVVLESYFDRYRYMTRLNLITHNTYAFCRLSYFLYGYSKPASLRVGRLNFQYIEYKDYCEMYEDKLGNRIFAALPNFTYNQKGLQEKDGFVPYYVKDDKHLTAHVFKDKGRLNTEATTMELNRLKPLLKPGDKVVTIHIPEDGKLLIEDVKRSIKDAWDLFSRYFPPFKAIVCQTWFIDPGLRGEVIKDGSNMAAFADLFDIISGTDNDNHSIYEHIFKVKRQPLENLVPQNDFQRRILERAVRGEKIYWGYGVLKKSIVEELELANHI